MRRARFIAGLAAAGVSAPRAALAQTARKLTIGYVPSTLFAPVFVAVERGYLHDAGFDAQLTPIVAGQDAMALVAQGQLDVAAAALSAAFFNAVDRGLQVKFVASTAYQPQHGYPSALLVRQDLWDGGLRSIAALRGKRIGWNGGAGAASAYYVARILRPANLHVSDVQPVNIATPDEEVALDRKAVDAVFAAAPFTELFQTKRLAHLIGTVPAGISASGLFFGPTLLGNPDQARALMSAFRKAGPEVSGDRFSSPQNLAIYQKYTQQSLDVLRSAPRYDVKPDLRIDQATLEDMQREFVAQGVLAYKQPLSPVQFVGRF